MRSTRPAQESQDDCRSLQLLEDNKLVLMNVTRLHWRQAAGERIRCSRGEVKYALVPTTVLWWYRRLLAGTVRIRRSVVGFQRHENRRRGSISYGSHFVKYLLMELGDFISNCLLQLSMQCNAGPLE